MTAAAARGNLVTVFLGERDVADCRAVAACGGGGGVDVYSATIIIILLLLLCRLGRCRVTTTRRRIKNEHGRVLYDGGGKGRRGELEATATSPPPIAHPHTRKSRRRNTRIASYAYFEITKSTVRKRIFYRFFPRWNDFPSESRV